MEHLLLQSAVSLAVVVYLVITSFLASSTSWFLQYLYDWNPIGHRYKVILRWIRRRLRRYLLSKIVNPLGLCVYCQGTWISIIVYMIIGWPLVYSIYGFFISAVFGILFVGSSYFHIEWLSKLCK